MIKACVRACVRDKGVRACVIRVIKACVRACVTKACVRACVRDKGALACVRACAMHVLNARARSRAFRVTRCSARPAAATRVTERLG